MVEKSHTAGWWPNLYEPLAHIGQRVADWFAPKSEASTLGEHYEIDLELPGVKTEDLDVSVRDNALTVRGEKRSEREEKGRTYFFSEREYGAFERSFRLPEDADLARIEANFKDGVLSLRIAKKAESQSEGRRIEIRKA
jgi:HSP20 family protein